MKQNSERLIVELEPNEVIVVGTNKAGFHAGGAARQAYEQFGLLSGFSEGLCNRTYAFPTLSEAGHQLADFSLRANIVMLKHCAADFPALTFYLTPVGTGIAGYSKEFMEEIIGKLPPNIIKVNW